MRLGCFLDNIREGCKQTGRSLRELLQEAYDMGIETVECSLESLEEDPEGMKAMLDDIGLEVSAVYATLDFGTAPDASYAYPLVDTAAYFGCHKILVIPGFTAVIGDPYTQTRQVGTPVMQQMAKNLRELAVYARSKAVLMMLEDYDNVAAPFCSEVQLRWFVDNVPALSVCFDTGNFMYADVSESTAFAMLKDRIVHVHLKDRDLVGDEEEEPVVNVKGMPMYDAPVGYGMVGMMDILRNLRAIEYDDILVIEHFRAPDQMRYLRASIEWIQEAWEAAEEDDEDME